MSLRFFSGLLVAFAAFGIATCVQQVDAQVLDKQSLLEKQTYFDNRDWDWYLENIPFFDCPEPDLVTTYYYRWELITKHLTYGSPDAGYLFTEFIDRPFWSGAYGAISCPAGHQLYEARWLRHPTIANDYSNYWLQTKGAQPRNYSNWLADSVLAVDRVHPNPKLLQSLLPGLVDNYRKWKERHYDANVGLFWQTGHDDGMEFNIASRQTQDILRGAPSYRPSFNAYMWADAIAIAEVAKRSGNVDLAKEFAEFAATLRETMLKKLWDPKRQFFFPMFKNDENRDGYDIKALTLVYESGRFAGDSHGRELIGYVPWQFNMLDSNPEYDVAWKKLMDRDGFYAEYGPSTVERNDPMFLLQNSCCWWSGQSWPYATTQTLKGLANLLQSRSSDAVSADDYVRLLNIYAKSHRKEGKPYLAEALHPDTGSFEGHDGYNHSEHYFHSGFCDLVISGLVGLDVVGGDPDGLNGEVRISPLAPKDWEYFALDGVMVRGHQITVIWDKDGSKYGMKDGAGKGLTVIVNGRIILNRPELTAVSFRLPDVTHHREESATKSPTDRPSFSHIVNHAVNNDGDYFPRVTASSTSENTSVSKIQDGNYWYLKNPPNRWESLGGTVEKEWIEVDFGVPRVVQTLKFYFLDDETNRDGAIAAPGQIAVSIQLDGEWKRLDGSRMGSIEGHRPTTMNLGDSMVRKVRLEMIPKVGRRVGLTEIEAWGQGATPYRVAPPPSGNIAYRPEGAEFPRATASHSDRFGGTAEKSNDGKTVFVPNPVNRWTSYESPDNTDWLQIQFEKPTRFSRVELAIYDDRGGVQAPKSYAIEVWVDSEWQRVRDEVHQPVEPRGSQWNEARFEPVTSDRLRIVFEHKLPAKSGVTEVMVWPD
jgi:hypothetical protein